MHARRRLPPGPGLLARKRHLSAGGNAAALAGGREPRFGATVLAGTGGTLIFTLLEKRKPVDVPSILPALLADFQVDHNHPVLNLLQGYFDRSDAVNFGRAFTSPPEGIRPRYLFHVFGTGDTYSPVATQRTFAQSAGLFVVGPVIDDHGLAMTAPPARGT